MKTAEKIGAFRDIIYLLTGYKTHVVRQNMCRATKMLKYLMM